MCGICGVVTAGEAIAPGQLQGMMEAMVHRGPDEAGSAQDGPAALGFRRLAILDVRDGHQPMQGEDPRIWSVVNGEIYNFIELREELEGLGHRFRTRCDAEVIPHLYEQWGIEAVGRLRGMFALGIWDGRDGTLWLGRDPFGIKPLYFVRRGTQLAFASELRALWASGLVEPAVDWQAVWHYLTLQYVPEPLSILQGVRRLPAGHLARFRGGELSLQRYFAPTLAPRADWTLPELAEAILDRLRESVRLHAVSDVPVGAYLSSGVDSNAVATLLSELVGRVDTFSIGFPGAGALDELMAARAAAARIGSRHHEVVVDAAEYQATLPAIVQSQEEPLADPSAPALYFLARAAKPWVTVVLSGEGADELFAGYPIYGEPDGLRFFEGLPPAVRRWLGWVARRLPAGVKGRGFFERGALPLEARFLGNAKIFSEAEKRALLGERLGGQSLIDTMDFVAPWYRATEQLDPVSRMQMVDMGTWLPGDILMKADKMSMAHAIELRVPFLDREVFALAATVPRRFKVARGVTKLALREAVSRLLPAEEARRPKLGFPVPFRRWVRREMREFAHDWLRSGGFWERQALSAWLAEPQPADPLWERKLWTLMIFNLWHDAVFARLVGGRVAGSCAAGGPRAD